MRGAPIIVDGDNVFKATCYTPCVAECDSSPNITATGEWVKPLNIAVDPRVIPLGSIVYIAEWDVYAKAYDTGSAIKRKRIDITLFDKKQAMRWGSGSVHLYWADKRTVEQILGSEV